MKILLINSFDTKGGAAKAAKRLHEALNYIGCKSLMLVQHKETDDPNILTETNKLKIFLSLFLVIFIVFLLLATDRVRLVLHTLLKGEQV